MNINEAFPSKYIAHTDIDGKRTILTMTEVKTEEVGKDKDLKAVLYFKGTDKGLVLNKTNARVIGEAYGEDTDNWFGQKISLYVVDTEYQGKPAKGIRVRIPSGDSKTSIAAQRPLEPPPKGATAKFGENPRGGEYAGELDDDIPF